MQRLHELFRRTAGERKTKHDGVYWIPAQDVEGRRQSGCKKQPRIPSLLGSRRIRGYRFIGYPQYGLSTSAALHFDLLAPLGCAQLSDAKTNNLRIVTGIFRASVELGVVRRAWGISPRWKLSFAS